MFQCKDIVFVLLVSVYGLVDGLSRIDPLVQTKGGLIKGIRSDHGYASFLGVPYGVVDKYNPFGPSAPHPGFKDTFEAYESNVCPQVYNGVSIGTLDCLTMNIYVPSIANSKNRLPVMVWIHGGAFTRGSAERDAKDPVVLLNNDVIVVAINYRVGIYGFMCLDHPDVSGNQGLKDQVLALRWINENIAAFGGDANQITVFGNSAGAMSVNFHLLSSYEKLFQRAIIQSGPGISPWTVTEINNLVPLMLTHELGFNTTDVSEALAYLSAIDSHLLVEIARDLEITISVADKLQPLTLPCIEKEFEGVENFFTDKPKDIKSKKVSTTPIIIGYASNEMSYQYGKANSDFFAAYDFGKIIKIGFDIEDVSEAIDEVRRFYIGDEEVNEDVKANITNFATDFLFGHPTQRMAEQFLDNGAKKVYRYIFSYVGGRNVHKMDFNYGPEDGASHSDELGYLFDPDRLVSEDVTLEDQLMVDRITTLWTNFAKYGDPTPQTSDLIPVKWEPITKTTQPYLDLNSELILRNRPFHGRMAFWDLFYKVYADKQIY